MNFYFTHESSSTLKSLSLFIAVTIIAKLILGLDDKFEIKFKKLAVVFHFLQTTQNLVISRCCFAGDGKKCSKNYNARAQPLFCSLILLFSDVPVAVVVVVS